MDPNRESAKAVIDSMHKQLQDFIQFCDVPEADNRMAKVLLEAEFYGNYLASLGQDASFDSLQLSTSAVSCLMLCRIHLDDLESFSESVGKRTMSDDEFHAMENTMNSLWRPISLLQSTFLTSTTTVIRDDLANLSTRVDDIIAHLEASVLQQQKGNQVTFNGEVTFQNCQVDFNSDPGVHAGAEHSKPLRNEGREYEEEGLSNKSHDNSQPSRNREDNAITKQPSAIGLSGSGQIVNIYPPEEGSANQDAFSFRGTIWPKGGISDKGKSANFKFDPRRAKNWISGDAVQSLGANVFVEPYARHGKSSEAFDGSPAHPSGAVQLSWTKNGTNVKSGEFLIQKEAQFGVILGREFMEEESVLGLDKPVPVHHSTVRFTPKKEASNAARERAEERKRKNQELTRSRQIKVKAKQLLQKVTPSTTSRSDASSTQTPKTEDSKTESRTNQESITSRTTW